MQNTSRMINRLPEYMDATKKSSMIYSLLDTIGIILEDGEAKIGDIMTSKWFSVASLPDLERIGSLFGLERLSGEDLTSYKTRLYTTVQELLKGVGTVASISTMVTAAMGVEPEIIENPKVPVSGGPHLLKAGEKWIEECRSAVETRPTITIHCITTTRSPTVANLNTGDRVTYNGLLRPGAFLTIYPDGYASLAGIDVTDRVTTTHNKIPELTRPRSEWVYQDINAFFDSSKFNSATLAGSEKYSVIVELHWEEAKPATFVVKLPMYSNKYQPTETFDPAAIKASIGYEQELRQEVRNLVEKVKTAGVDAQINFWDDFTEKVVIKDEVKAQVNSISKEKQKVLEKFELEGQVAFDEHHQISEKFIITGAFDLTTFDSENRFG